MPKGAVYRPSIGMRAACIVVVGGLIAVAVGVLVAPTDPLTTVIAALASGGGASLFVLAAVRLRLELGHSMVISHLFTTASLGWREIADVELGS